MDFTDLPWVGQGNPRVFCEFFIYWPACISILREFAGLYCESSEPGQWPDFA
jgi:hypothetical protein